MDELPSGMHELNGMERATQVVPGDGGRREGVHGQEDGGSELSGEAGLGGGVEEGGRGAEGVAASRPREPLKQVVVMCYFGNSDPIKIQQNVEVSAREKARFFKHAPWVLERVLSLECVLLLGLMAGPEHANRQGLWSTEPPRPPLLRAFLRFAGGVHRLRGAAADGALRGATEMAAGCR